MEKVRRAPGVEQLALGVEAPLFGAQKENALGIASVECPGDFRIGSLRIPSETVAIIANGSADGFHLNSGGCVRARDTARIGQLRGRSAGPRRFSGH